MNFSDLEFPSLIIAIVANLSLVIVVLRYAPKNQSRILFVLFGLSQAIWIAVNFFAIRSSPEQILNLARWTIATAVPHPILFFLFITSFLSKTPKIKRPHVFLVVLLIVALIVLAISPYVFTHLEMLNGQPTPIAGPGMAVFGFYALVFIVLSFIHLFRSWKKAQSVEKRQWRFIGIGLLLTFVLILTFNFILVVLFDELQYISFGHIYTLPFVVFTAYAMVKHHLLNIKVIATELGVTLLALVLLTQLLTSTSIAQLIFNFIIFCKCNYCGHSAY